MKQNSSGIAGKTKVTPSVLYLMALSPAIYLAGLKLLLHWATNGQYGYNVDELYYLDCGDHLAWGFADNPPLIALLAKTTRVLLGESLFAVRFLPALAGAVLVLQTGAIVRELGGGRRAQLLACLCVVIAPVFLALHTMLTMNAFEPLFWMSAAYLSILIVKYNRPQLWLLFGVVTGLGLLNKHSMLFFCCSLMVGLLLTPQRRQFASPWLWAGVCMAVLIVLPNLLFQIEHHWPTLERLQNAKRTEVFPASPAIFLGGQILFLLPLTLPVWLGGVFYLLRARESEPFRFLGWTYIILAMFFTLLKAKINYLAPIYPMLFAAGAIAIEHQLHLRSLQNQSAVQRWRLGFISTLILAGVVAMPFSLPVLPPPVLERVAQALHLQQAAGHRHRLPIFSFHFPEMFGWENVVAQTAKAYHSLPPHQRKQCAIWTSYYGYAAAINFFGPRYGLPRAISGNQHYYMLGPREYSGRLVLSVGFSRRSLTPVFRQVEEKEVATCLYCRPYVDKVTDYAQDRVEIFLCRDLKMPLRQFWPQVKCYNCEQPPFVESAYGMSNPAPENASVLGGN